jgi:hypothetical protein
MSRESGVPGLGHRGFEDVDPAALCRTILPARITATQAPWPSTARPTSARAAR